MLNLTLVYKLISQNIIFEDILRKINGSSP